MNLSCRAAEGVIGGFGTVDTKNFKKGGCCNYSPAEDAGDAAKL